MSAALPILLQILFGMLVVNVVFAALQAKSSKGSNASLTALGLWLTTMALFVGAGLLSTYEVGLITVVGHTFSFLQGLILLRFAHTTFDTPFRPQRYFLALPMAWGAALVLHQLGLPFWAYCLPVTFLVAAPFWEAGYRTLRATPWRKLSFVAKNFVVACFAIGLHDLDFPFLRPNPEATMVGASLIFVLLYILSLTLPALVDERSRRDYEKVLENEVNQKTQMLLSSSRMAALGEMAGGVAHEINNPLAVIANSVSILNEQAESDQIDRELLRRYLKTIDKTVKRIASIVLGLRTFARDPEKDPMTRASLATIVEETLPFCQEKLKQRGIELRVDPIPAEVELECRPGQISQVILNLLNNAADAIEGLPEKWIRIGMIRDRGQVRLRISDSGKGIPKEIRDRIFQPFYTTKPVGQGTGLGLSISSGIVRAHRGALTLDPAAPNTTFVITLPAV